MRPRPTPILAVLAGLLVAPVLLSGCRPASDAAPNAPESQADPAPALRDSVLSPPDTTAARFEAAMTEALSHRDETESIGALMQTIGLHFRGRPYLAGTLDQPATETLVARFDGFDCVTFVETTLALARSAEAADSTYAASPVASPSSATATAARWATAGAYTTSRSGWPTTRTAASCVDWGPSFRAARCATRSTS